MWGFFEKIADLGSDYLGLFRDTKEPLRSYLMVLVLAPFTFLLIALLFLAASKVDRNSFRNFFNSNKLVVETSQELDRRQVRILWNTENIPEKTVLFEQGKDLGKTYKEEKKNFFYIYYGNDLVGKFSHDKSEAWHGHTYTIRLHTGGSGYVVPLLEVEGEDRNVRWEKP